MPIVMKRIAQGGIRLAMFFNRIFGDSDEEFAVATWEKTTKFDTTNRHKIIIQLLFLYVQINRDNLLLYVHPSLIITT